MTYQEILTITTSGRGTTDITRSLQGILKRSAIIRGICNIFIQHTSASLIICENADPVVRADLERFLQRLAPDGDAAWQHDMEGADDMPAHLRSILTDCSLTIPVSEGRMMLGTWQGVYLYEHRYAGHQRSIIVTLWGGN